MMILLARINRHRQCPRWRESSHF